MHSTVDTHLLAHLGTMNALPSELGSAPTALKHGMRPQLLAMQFMCSVHEADDPELEL